MTTGHQQRLRSATVFDRARAVLCLVLLLFSVAHTVFGHADLQPMQHPATANVGHQAAPLSPDTPDACALCVAMATAVPLPTYLIGVPEAARPRPPAVVVRSALVSGWHVSLFSRPPPTA